jgi:hypothetical protein
MGPFEYKELYDNSGDNLSLPFLQYPSPELEAHSGKTNLLSWIVEILWPRLLAHCLL